jgi:hypothetical protein
LSCILFFLQKSKLYYLRRCNITTSFFNFKNLDAAIWNILTIREAAMIAEACYETSNASRLPQGWKSANIEERFLAKENEGQETSPAFFVRVFVHLELKEAIIGFAGLQKIADLFLCAKFSLVNKLPVWEKLDAFVQKRALPELQKMGIHFVRVLGHSLGGSIAHLVGNRYNCPSLSIDGLGVKQLISDPSNESLAKTIAIIPNALNQLGNAFGEILYVFPGEMHYDYGIDIDEYLERFLFVEEVCSKDENWSNSKDPFDLALYLVHKTVAFHAISNFTEAKPDEDSAKIFFEALKHGIETTTWKEAQETFAQGVAKGFTDFSNGCEFLGLSTLDGSKAGYFIGKVVGSATGKVVGGVLGASAVGTTLGIYGAVDGGWSWGKIGLGLGLGAATIVCVCIPGLQAALPALPAVANAIVTVAPAATAYAGTIATVTGTTLAGGAAVGTVGAVKNGVSAGAVGVAIGWEDGKWLGEKIGAGVGSGLGIVVGSAAGVGSALPTTLHCFAQGGAEVASGSKGAAFFLMFFYLRPKISCVVVHRAKSNIRSQNGIKSQFNDC